MNNHHWDFVLSRGITQIPNVSLFFGIAIVPLAFALANQCLYFLPVCSVIIVGYVICEFDDAVWVVEVEDRTEDWTEVTVLGDTSAESDGGGEVVSGADTLWCADEKVFNPRA